ncbi:PASTA domain-containing protein [Streptomyces sp. YU58]|uniref:PASTA domain-containing protein n=1 Tax=Streptomyces sp. SX92 TaxID=3158972 RepID=UPI0027BB0230|nr:PASTA domain-containing protein [Streptomyces coralus]WLW53041.1 PASTA domain-containing protein [Streptomyces coralus]
MNWIRGRGRAAVTLVATLVVLGLLATGCFAAKNVLVRAVARGVPTAAPFFKNLGTDIAIGAALSAIAGEIGGGDPGLYGGTRDAGHCDKDRLVDFLKKPGNRDKAKAWADAQGLDGVDEIEGFVKKLTPVLLRTDTLVKNHDFKKGKADAFDALLEAGIAILVDEFGKPAVQCSCGNPLASFEHDTDKADVKFEGPNKKWPSYDADKLTKVKPKDEPVEVYQLVDVEDPDTGLAREAGSDGTDDEVLPDPDDASASPSDSASATEETTATVPDVHGQSLADAQAALEALGFEVATAEEITDTAVPGTVIDQGPDAGTEAPAGSEVTLTIASGGGIETDPPVTDGPTDDIVDEETGGTGETTDSGFGG